MTKAYGPHLVNSCHGSFTALDGGTDIPSCLLLSPAAMTTSPLTSVWRWERTEGLQRASSATLLHSRFPLLPPHFHLRPLLSLIPFFFFLFDLWPLKCMAVGITKQWSCHVNSLCCDYASDSDVSRGRKGPDLGQVDFTVSVPCEDRVEESTQLWHVFPPLVVCQIRLISNVHHSLNGTDRWKWRLNGW